MSSGGSLKIDGEAITHHDLAERLKLARKAEGMSQRVLGELTGGNASTVANFEKGRGLQNAARFFRYMDVLGYDVKFVKREAKKPIPRRPHRNTSHIPYKPPYHGPSGW